MACVLRKAGLRSHYFVFSVRGQQMLYTRRGRRHCGQLWAALYCKKRRTTLTGFRRCVKNTLLGNHIIQFYDL